VILQICGTNASGKTTAIRTIKDKALSAEPVIKEGKKKIWGYDLTFEGVELPVRLMGPYEEAATGGMDALSGKAEETYEWIRQEHEEGRHVLLEGIRMHNHMRGVAMMKLGIPYHVFILTTPIEVVLESLKERRAARGADMLENTSHVEANMRRASNYAFKMYESGAKRYKVSREECPIKVLEVLRNG